MSSQNYPGFCPPEIKEYNDFESVLEELEQVYREEDKDGLVSEVDEAREKVESY
ncbi:MAG: hypothetical protein ABEJ95_04720 [Candidatus Nanohalobium sp.]